MTWSGRVHSIQPFYADISLIGGADGLGCGLFTAEVLPAVLPPLTRYLTEVSPYKRVQYAAKLLDSTFDVSPKHTLSVSKRRSLESISLYKSEDEKSFTTIVQTRLLRERGVSLYKALQPILQTRRKAILTKIKEHSDALMWYRQTIAVMALPQIIVSIFSREVQQTLTFVFSVLKLANFSTSWRYRSSLEALPNTDEDGELTMTEFLAELKSYAAKEHQLPSTNETSSASVRLPEILELDALGRFSSRACVQAVELLTRVVKRQVLCRITSPWQAPADSFMMSLQGIKRVGVSLVKDQSLLDSVVILEADDDYSDAPLTQRTSQESLRLSPIRPLRTAPVSKNASRLASHSPVFETMTLNSSRMSPMFTKTMDSKLKNSFCLTLDRFTKPTFKANSHQRALEYSRQLSRRLKKSPSLTTTIKNHQTSSHNHFRGPCQTPSCYLNELKEERKGAKKTLHRQGFSATTLSMYFKSKKTSDSAPLRASVMLNVLKKTQQNIDKRLKKASLQAFKRW